MLFIRCFVEWIFHVMHRPAYCWFISMKYTQPIHYMSNIRLHILLAILLVAIVYYTPWCVHASILFTASQIAFAWQLNEKITHTHTNTRSHHQLFVWIVYDCVIKTFIAIWLNLPATEFVFFFCFQECESVISSLDELYVI